MRRMRGLGMVTSICVSCGLIAAVFPGWRDRSLAIATLVAFAFFALVVIRRAIDGSRRRRSIFDDLLEGRPPRVARPPDLVRIESALGWKSYSRAEFEHRAGPLLRDLTAYRLRARSLADLVGNPGSARPYLSPRLWETVTSPGARRDGDLGDGPPSPGQIRTADIAAMLEEIESL